MKMRTLVGGGDIADVKGFREAMMSGPPPITISVKKQPFWLRLCIGLLPGLMFVVGFAIAYIWYG
jgi:hypothetical protein